MTESEIRDIQADALRRFGGRLTRMVHVGGSPHVTEALAVVARLAYQEATRVGAGQWDAPRSGS